MANDKPVTVTQADRDAAAEVERAQFALHPDIAEKVSALTIAGGRDRTMTVQAFARHRTAHAPSQHSELADRLEALAVNLDDRFEDAINLCKESAAALRQSPQDTVRRDAWEQAAKVADGFNTTSAFDLPCSPFDRTEAIVAAIRALATKDAK